MKNTHLAASIELTASKIKSCVARMSVIMKPGLLRLPIALAGGSAIPLRRIALRRYAGFTLIELILVVAILGVLGTLGASQYADYQDKLRVAQLKSDIKKIDVLLARYYSDNRGFPQQLSAVGADAMRDPWGNPYQYLEILSGTSPGVGNLRKDKSLTPINSDYDLYSMGKDGKSKPPLTAQDSQDDFIRASNGQYVGFASAY